MRIYGLTVLGSSLLLFAVQPIVAKAILPWFGGSPAVWTTCMLFFQAVLLAGYAYAHVLTRVLSRRAQAFVHIGLLAGTLLLLPLAADPGGQPTGEENPAFRILALLGASVGLPYFLLSSTAPLIQSWATGGGSVAAPYRLYALSNAGSLAALLGYPLAVEPLSTLGTQFHAWSIGYAVFVALCTFAALGTGRRAGAEDEPGAVAAGEPIALGRIAMWALLPGLSSVLLLAVTNQMCREIAVVPLLWLLPLTVYLLTFILCFESDRWYRRRPYLVALGVLSVLALAGFVLASALSARVGIAVFMLYLFVACMACHGEAVRLRPPAGQLTLFYLMLSLGSVAGALLVALVAPSIFTAYYEFPVAVLLTLSVILHARDPAPLRDCLRFGAFLVVVALAASNLHLALGGPGDLRVAARNFYGTLRAFESGPEGERVRTLSHGGTVHGVQSVAPADRREPRSYYDRRSGAGQLLAKFRTDGPRRIGILGLGVGTLAAYGRPGDAFRFYEINPLVIELARREFTYLADTPANVEIVTADARLALERERDQPPFDVLLADAFSGDAIPVHLLTEQAFRTYFQRLGPQGIFAIHISNRQLDLRPVVAAALRSLGRAAVIVESRQMQGQGRTTWILAAADRSTLDALALADATPLAVPREILWRDDFSSLFQILK